MTSRVWENGPATPLSAAMLNGMETDIQTALEVPDGALAARLEDEAGEGRAALDAVVSAAIAGKEDDLGEGTTEQFLRGDKTWATIAGGGAGLVTTYAELVAAVAAGGTVRVGDAPITITAKVNVTTSTTIVGGNFVLPTSAGYPAFEVTSSNVTFDGCKFTGAGSSAVYDINSRFIYAWGSLATYLTNIRIVNCDMRGCQTENVRLVCVRGFNVDRNLMDDFLYAGALLLSCEDGTANGNNITNGIMKAPVVNVYGIAASDSVNTVAARSRNIKIQGNTIENVQWEGIDTHGGEAIIITGNTVISCVRGIALVVGNETRLTVPVDCVVSGNFVDKGTSTGTEREGISLFGLSGNNASAVITGNIVKGYSPANAIWIDPVFANPLKTLVEGNSHPHVPWTNLTMDNPTNWTPNGSFVPQYMIDGRTVYFRGFATSASSSQANTKIGVMSHVAARPTRLTFVNSAHGSNSAAGHIVVGCYETGEVWALYKTSTDLYSYPIEGSFQRNYTG